MLKLNINLLPIILMAHHLFIQAYDYDSSGKELNLAQPFTTITGDISPFGYGDEVAMDQDSNRRRLRHRKVKTADDSTKAQNKKRKPQSLARHVTIPKPTGNVAKKEVRIDVKTNNDPKDKPGFTVLSATYTASGKFSVRIRELAERRSTKSARTRTRIFRNPDKTIRGVLYARGQTRVCISPA